MAEHLEYVTDESTDLPFSEAVRVGSMVYVSGQVPIDTETGQEVTGSIEAQTVQTLQNVVNVLEQAGASPDNIVKTTVYVRNIDDFELVNKVYRNFFDRPFPARTAVEIRDLSIEGDIEIDAVAHLDP